jgi:hypothetical protein
LDQKPTSCPTAALVALADRESGAGEKLTTSVAVADDAVAAMLLVGVLMLEVEAAGLVAGLTTGFFSAAGTPTLIGESTETTLTGTVTGLGAGLAAGALTGSAFFTTATVRVGVTDFAQTVTDVALVFEACAKPSEVAAVQAQVGVGES